jgi:hypothetical protein
MLSLPHRITLLHHLSLLAGVAACFAWTAPTGAVQPEAFSAGPGARQVNADINGDGMVNLDDFVILAGCMAGPDEHVPPPGCIYEEFAASDLDDDADVDLRDFALFAEHFAQPFPDCNGNGIPDDVDIAEGTSQDCNENGVPDECDIADGTSEDCNGNDVPDECDISGTVMDPNLIHRYRFDGTAADSMGGGDAVLYGGATLSADALVLDGVDGYAELPIAGTIASLDSCTFEAWVRWNGGGTWQRIFDVGTATNNYFFLTPFSGSEARSAIRTPMVGEQQMLAGSALPSGGVLTHVAVTIDDATNTGRLYVDGVLAGPTAENTNVTLRPSDLGTGAISYLGKSFWPDPCFNGEIVEFRVYDRALSAADLAQSFASGPDIAEAVSQDCNTNGVPDECDIVPSEVLDANLVHRYRFNATPADSMGGGDAVLYGGATLSADALVLDGIDGHAELPIGDTIASLDSCTFEAWVRWNGGGTWQRVFDIGTGTSNYIFLTPGAGGTAIAAIRTWAAGDSVMTAQGLLPSGGALTHVAVTIDDATNTGRLYVDGALAGALAENTDVVQRPSDFGPGILAYLGKSLYEADPYFHGEIVEFRVYDRALSAADLADSHAAGPDHELLTSEDCNTNGIPDECDIASGFSQDLNGNGVPDECEAEDCNGNGIPDHLDIAGILIHDALRHRYTFRSGMRDLVGDAHGTAVNGAYTVDGTLVLDGVDDYAELPISDTVAELESATFEAWFIWDGSAQSNLFTTGASYQKWMGFSPYHEVYWTGPPCLQFTVHPEPDWWLIGWGHTVQPETVAHVAFTLDGDTDTARLYLNGQTVSTSTTFTQSPADFGATTLSWLGRSMRPADGYFQGRVLEYRVYDAALSQTEIADSFAAGPDHGGASEDCNENGIPDECDIASGFSQDLNGNGVPDECEPADCNGNGVPDDVDIAEGTSLDCNENEVPDECDIAEGTSEDCNGNGVPDECDVAQPPLPASVVHRYRFNENGDDAVSGAHAVLLNGAFLSDGAVVLDGVNDMVQLPISATIAGLTDVTFEVWFVWEEGDSAAVFTSQTSTQNHLNFSVSGSSSMFSIRTPEIDAQSLFGGGITSGQLTHAAITIDPGSTFGRHYLNGIPGPFNTGMTLTPSDLGAGTNTLLGRSVFSWAPYFKGIISEFRIYTEALSAQEVLASYEAGPDAGSGSRDCNEDGVPDECQLEDNDCNENGIPDECDIASGFSQDLNENGIPDECEEWRVPGSAWPNRKSAGGLAHRRIRPGRRGGPRSPDPCPIEATARGAGAAFG